MNKIFVYLKKYLNKRRIFAWLGQLIILVFLVQVVSWWQARDLLSVGTEVATPNLVTLDQKAFSFTSKRKVLYFFAPWCTVCKLHFDAINDFQARQTEVVAIALAYENANEVETFVRQQKANVPVLLGDAAVTRNFKVSAFPTIYFIDEHNRIRAKSIGYTTSLGMQVRNLF